MTVTEGAIKRPVWSIVGVASTVTVYSTPSAEVTTTLVMVVSVAPPSRDAPSGALFAWEGKSARVKWRVGVKWREGKSARVKWRVGVKWRVQGSGG